MIIQKNNVFNSINEFHNPSMTDEELLEMSNFWGDGLGLDENIVLWIGSSLSSKHGNRIKVSNIPSKDMGTSRDCFSITVPDLNIIGDINTKHITTKKLKTIFGFIKLNEQTIIDFCEEKIDGIEFGKRLKKYNEEK